MQLYGSLCLTFTGNAMFSRILNIFREMHKLQSSCVNRQVSCDDCLHMNVAAVFPCSPVQAAGGWWLVVGGCMVANCSSFAGQSRFLTLCILVCFNQYQCPGFCLRSAVCTEHWAWAAYTAHNVTVANSWYISWFLLPAHMKRVLGISDISGSWRSYGRGLPHAMPNPGASIHKLPDQHSPPGSWLLNWAKPVHIASLTVCDA